jgi:hypothetical protein
MSACEVIVCAYEAAEQAPPSAKKQNEKMICGFRRDDLGSFEASAVLK